MKTTFRDLFTMLLSGYLTLIVPVWMLPITVGAGLVTAVLVIMEMARNKNPRTP